MTRCVRIFSEKHRRTSGSASENTLNRKLHIMRKGAKRDCIVCSNREFKGERHIMSYYCIACANKPRMDVEDCFHR